jgi:hypothetical protein
MNNIIEIKKGDIFKLFTNGYIEHGFGADAKRVYFFFKIFHNSKVKNMMGRKRYVELKN